jgi:menaquinone-dependent protoporphyrinogen oxidase
MSEILILYASAHGQTLAIAETIAARLRTGGHSAVLAPAAEHPPEPEAYDAVVIGSRVSFGRHARSIARYIVAHRGALRDMPTAFFSVSMSAASARDPDPAGYIARLYFDTGWHADRAIAFGGALSYTKYGPLVRYVMKQLARRQGQPTDITHDHVFTDWDAVDRFAVAIAEDVERAMAPPQYATPTLLGEHPSP